MHFRLISNHRQILGMRKAPATGVCLVHEVGEIS